MPYCTSQDVRLIIKTQLLDRDIENLILMADAKINAQVGTQTEGDQLVRGTSALMVALKIRQSDPSSFAIGGYSESSHDPTADWKKEIEENIEILESLSGTKCIFEAIT